MRSHTDATVFAEITAESANAVLVGGEWVPKSACVYLSKKTGEATPSGDYHQPAKEEIDEASHVVALARWYVRKNKNFVARLRSKPFHKNRKNS